MIFSLSFILVYINVQLLKGTPLGVAMLAVYALIAQILLVNLLIGDHHNFIVLN